MLLSKKMHLLLSIISLGLASCNSSSHVGNGSGQGGAWQSRLKNSKARVAASGNVIQGVDLFTLNDGVLSKDSNLEASSKIGLKGEDSTVCFSDNSVCVNITNDFMPEASYISDKGIKRWLRRDIAFSLTVHFNKTVSSGFRVHRIYNQLPNGDGVSTGYLSQINTTKCDQSSKTQGSSCIIELMYSGSVQPTANSMGEKIFIEFTDDSNQILSVPINFQNSLYSDNLTPYLVVTGASSDGIINFLGYPQEDSRDNSDIIFDEHTKGMITNYSTTKITGMPDLASIEIAYGTNFNADKLQWVFDKNLYTTCLDKDIAPLGSVGDTCDFGFNSRLIDPNNSTWVYPQFSRLVFTFYDNDGNPVISTLRTIVSEGDFVYLGKKNISLNNSSSFTISKINLGGENVGFSYTPKDRDFSLSLEYNPNFDLFHVNSGDKVEYFYGDLYVNGTVQRPENIVSNIKLNYDHSCFENIFDINDPDPVGSALNGRACKVTTQLKTPATYSIPVVAAQLFATYFSYVDGRYHKQYLGNLIINN